LGWDAQTRISVCRGFEKMKNPNTTITLIVAIILLAMWKSGRLDRLFKIAFGPGK
jgi:hypothetical protein